MKSLWQKTAEPQHFPPLDGDIKTDVLIIGGGMAGILTAYFLHQRGVSYVLVEKDRICRGISGNTTAKITFQHGLIYHKLLKNGESIARAYLNSNREALGIFSRLCRETDCDYEIKDNYVYSSDINKLEYELEALQKLGCSAGFCEEVPIPVKVAGAVRISDQAQFNPMKFVSHISKGLKIFENTFVREMIGTTAVTDRGKINAEKVIVATHFPFINKHGSYFLKLYQHRSYVIALEGAQNVDGMYVDDEKKGMSFRNYKNLLLVGGGDHRTGQQGGNWAELRDFARVHYPDAKEKHHWAAQDTMSLDGIPYIGRYSKNIPDMYVASGFNKWGMTGAMAAAYVLSDLVTGKRNDYEELFSPSRSILKPQLAVNGFEAVKNLLTFTGKRCPHMGCALKWNKAEHSWDCPCHGSRFSGNGKLLDNPANGDLSGNTNMNKNDNTL